MSSGRRYDVCVVGSGLIGSAAARHLVENNPSLRVALIGPDEPQDRSKTDIHGAWYDQGRITRVLDPDPTWGFLAQRSINNYHDLQIKSGITFYGPVGFLYLSGGQIVSKLKESALQFNQQIQVLESAALKYKFPFMNVQPDIVGVYSRENAGYINPREMVYAQQQVCRQQGCDIIREVVDRIDPHKPQGWVLNLASGQLITAHKVLVAVGAFSGFRSLLPGNALPDMDFYGVTVLLVEVEAEDLPHFEGMPSILTEGSLQYSGKQEAQNEACFILPPIKYPDGKCYMKIGGGWGQKVKIESVQEIQEWCTRGSGPAVHQWLLARARGLLPGLKINNYMFDHCVITYTPTGQLYVDMVAPGFGVALGGCGYAAKSSDEIGHMASRMIAAGGWNYDLLPAEQFRFKLKTVPSRI